MIIIHTNCIAYCSVSQNNCNMTSPHRAALLSINNKVGEQAGDTFISDWCIALNIPCWQQFGPSWVGQRIWVEPQQQEGL